MQKFTKKPVTIEAVQYDGSPDSRDYIVSVARGSKTPAYAESDPNDYGVRLMIETLEGSHRVSVGDWVIKGVKGEFYPCKPDIFEASYVEGNGVPTDIVEQPPQPQFAGFAGVAPAYTLPLDAFWRVAALDRALQTQNAVAPHVVVDAAREYEAYLRGVVRVKDSEAK